MAGLQELDFAQFAFVVEFFAEEKFAGVDDSLGHHVFQACVFDEFDDGFAVFDAGGHGDGTHDVLAGLERGDRLRGVIGNGGIDVDEIDFGVFQDVGVIGVALGDFEVIANLIEFFLVALADGVHVGLGMLLIDGDEFSAETQADNGDVGFAVGHVNLLRR